MTKREICERLIKTRDYLAAYEKTLIKNNSIFDADDLGSCADALRDIILDIAAPETEKEAALKERRRAVLGNIAATGKKEPKAEEKHHGIIVDPSGKNPPRCLKCNTEALTKHNLFAVGDEWVCCGKCKAMFRMKPEPEEGEQYA